MKQEIISVACPKCKWEYKVLNPNRPKAHYCARCFAIFIVEPNHLPPKKGTKSSIV